MSSAIFVQKARAKERPYEGSLQRFQVLHLDIFSTGDGEEDGTKDPSVGCEGIIPGLCSRRGFAQRQRSCEGQKKASRCSPARSPELFLLHPTGCSPLQVAKRQTNSDTLF